MKSIAFGQRYFTQGGGTKMHCRKALGGSKAVG